MHLVQKIVACSSRVVWTFSVVCLLQSSFDACADFTAESLNTHAFRYVMGLDVGISVTTNVGNTASVPIGYSTFSYTPNNQTDDPLRFGAFLGRRFQLSPQNALQVGVSYHYITNMGVGGVLQQGISPALSSFTYHYSMDSSQFLAELKLLRQWRGLFYPYLTGAIGAGVNRARNYTTSIPEYLTLTPNYANQSTTAFSYTVGVGVDVLKVQSLSVGIGYRFSDLGSVALGNARIRNTPIASQLGQSNLYLNTALLELSYFF